MASRFRSRQDPLSPNHSSTRVTRAEWSQPPLPLAMRGRGGWVRWLKRGKSQLGSWYLFPDPGVDFQINSVGVTLFTRLLTGRGHKEVRPDPLVRRNFSPESG